MFDIDKQLEKVTVRNSEKDLKIFTGLFKELYKITLFKDSLDLCLSLCELDLFSFDLDIQKGWVNLQGCCITEQRGLFHKAYKVFFTKYKHHINLHKLDVAVLMHEIAHAMEKQSKLDIREGFETAFKKDLEKLPDMHMNIRRAVDQIIFRDVALYDKSQYNAEYLARFFELIAMGKEVGHYDDQYHFKATEMMKLFNNTVSWIRDIFNANLKTRIPEHVALATMKIEFDGNINSHQYKHESFHAKTEGKVSWGKAVGKKLD